MESGTLPHHFIQAYARSHRYVQARNASLHGNPQQEIAVLFRQSSHPFPFRPHHQCGRPREVRFIQAAVSFVRRAEYPDAAALELLHGARQIGHLNKRHLFRSADGNAQHRLRNAHGFVPGGDDGIHSRAVRRPQDGSQVVGGPARSPESAAEGWRICPESRPAPPLPAPSRQFWTARCAHVCSGALPVRSLGVSCP